MEYELKERLPMYLIEEALKEYSEDHQVEFDTEPVGTSVTKTMDGEYKIIKANKFLEPENRFMTRFVKAFYNYLLAEAPPSDKDYMPSERYYAIIAIMLQRTWFFYHQRNPEWFITAKVKQWHKLSLRE